ncbi:RNA binding protein [Talaromyces stipitatus ATCC 10500]|uniref:RNA binding protein n=1 Tax=Talaromyces stipitatus (strain ATCC 10500 / CBS 375.48 / QM 6759 / NRRL 1006) TaxID=441959 RepID=B8MMW8_TALSN|nr:RNA binding protein [Talaromyces stipitatus ATCC 10500]EED13917.1 RNA binding protein [Talaromyces stipitatus ATCC 10500]
MGDRKRKREEATGGGAEQQKPKRVKNKVKYLPKGNKGRKRATHLANQPGNGANAIPVQERVRDVPEDAAVPAEETKAVEEGSKLAGEDFFVIDTTPMNVEEVEQKKKSKGQLKREHQAAKEAEHHSAEWLAEKEKEKKRREARERRGRNDKRKETKQKEESKKRKERKERELKAEEEEKEDDKTTSSSSSESDSDSDSDSSSSSGSESGTKKATTPKVVEKKAERKKDAPKETKQEDQANKPRFIVFVGNLPYTATIESVKAHFSKIQPISVRVATDKKNSDKCRGFGFVEFEQFDRMQTCLKLYHHSSFDDGKSPARKINVELTAGGGGKSETRRTKLKEKNQKLAEERAKNAQEEKKKKQQNKGGEEKKEEGGEYSGIHPSRLNMMR